MEFGYWGFRGLANPMRLALEYAGVEYTDKRFASKEEWHAHRDGALKEAGVAFPSLPYLLCGDGTWVAQSRVILRYVAEKHGFGGESDAERWAAAMVQEECGDLFAAYVKVAFAADDAREAARKEQIAGSITTHMGRLEAFLADKEWVAGGAGVTYADLVLFDVVEWMWSLDGELKDAYPKLRSLHERVGELPAIKAYVARKDGDKPYIDRPFTPSKLG